jgi:peptidoglycan/LPS O-acetylase OafA/YrhL
MAGRHELAESRLLTESRRHDIPALTGLRFVAAFLVLIGHGAPTILKDHVTPWGAIYWISQLSGFGMTLFFVLSGFVIHYNYATLITEERFRGVAAYLWARFARLYPLFLLMMLVYVLVSSRTSDLLLGHSERFATIPQALPYFLLSIQSWFYGLVDGIPVIDAIGGGSQLTWSISTEWFFYFVYPCIAWLILRSRAAALTVLVALVWCVLWGALASGLFDRSPLIDEWAIRHFGSNAGVQEHLQQSFVRWLLFFSPYLRVGEFILGAVIARLYVQLRDRGPTQPESMIGTAAFFAAAASVVLITYLNYSPDVGGNIFRKMNMNFALAPSAALLIFCAARYRNFGSYILATRPAVALGEASYSIYLVHYIVLMSALRLTGSAVHGIAYDLTKLLFLIIVVFLISLMLYSYYEAPARRWLRGRWRTRSSPIALAQSPRSSVS